MITIRKFKKKPLVIEAIRYQGDWPQINHDLKEWGLTKWHYGHYDMQAEKHVLVIETLEGEMEVDVGDYIIKGIKGEFYPCKPDIFEASYDVVECLTTMRSLIDSKIKELESADSEQ
jgi:hypothetical protein